MNVNGVVNVSQVVAKGMIERGNGGCIINVSSLVKKTSFLFLSLIQILVKNVVIGPLHNTLLCLLTCEAYVHLPIYQYVDIARVCINIPAKKISSE